MGTKNNPGEYDCYANADPDEPMFVLLGRDRHAAGLVRLWAILRAKDGEEEAKVAEALECAAAMDKWRLDRGGLPGLEGAPFEPFYMTVSEGMDKHPEGWDVPCDCNLCRSYD